MASILKAAFVVLSCLLTLPPCQGQPIRQTFHYSFLGSLKVAVPHVNVWLNMCLLACLSALLKSHYAICSHQPLAFFCQHYVCMIYLDVCAQFYSFLFMVKYYFLRIYLNLFIYSLLVNYYLDCFQIGATMNRVATFSWNKSPGAHVQEFLQGQYVTVELPDCTVFTKSPLYKYDNDFPKQLHQFRLPLAVFESALVHILADKWQYQTS